MSSVRSLCTTVPAFTTAQAGVAKTTALVRTATKPKTTSTGKTV
jgi:hypothetical protein